MLRAGIELVLEEVRAAVEDWGRDARPDDRAGHRAAPPGAARASSTSSTSAEAFLAWLADDHFTFLGYREYELSPGEESGAS